MRTASETAPAAGGSLGRGANDPIRARRQAQGVTRRELAARVGASKSALAGIENGHHRPSLELARRIADALEADVAELFELRECACGCGEPMVDQARLGSSARFLPGHNSREFEHSVAATRAHRARRARLGIPEEKTCKRCGRTFTRSEVPNQSLAHWLAREHCSFECAHGPPVELRPCAVCGEPFKPSWSADPSLRCCCGSHGQQFRFEAGNVPPEFVAQMPGRARQRHGGKWAGRKAGRLGGRQRGYSDEQRDWVLALRKQGIGFKRAAQITGLSPKQTRTIFTAKA
jgi:putative transcriptional regulator